MLSTSSAKSSGRRATKANAFLLLALVLIACGGAEGRTAATAGRPSWFSYERPAEFQALGQRVSVPVEGAVLACDLTRRARDGQLAPGRFPALMYDFTSYHRPTDQPQTDPAESYFAERGYAVLQCDVPGTGSSPGPRYDLNNDVEVPAGHDAVEWLAAQEWSTGQVGMTGTSYGGWMALRVAASQPDGLSDGAQRSVTVRLQPTDWVVRAGHRIGVVVSSGDSPKLARTASPGRVEVLTGDGGSTISLPVVT